MLLGAVTSGILLTYAALYGLLLVELVAWAGRSLAAAAAAFTVTLAVGVKVGRWVLQSLFDLWSTTWAYRSIDGACWGTVSTLFGWYGAGEGVHLTEFHPTPAGSTHLCSSDAIAAGLPAVASNLSRLLGTKGHGAFSPFEVLMLSAFAGLVARGDATISRATAVRWRVDWLDGARRGAPQTIFTIERASQREAEGEVEREILDVLQTRASGIAARVEPAHEPSAMRPARLGGYRAPARRPPPMHFRVEEVLRPRLLALAARAAEQEVCGGAPVAVAAAIDEFAQRDPARLAHLRLLLAEHHRRARSA